MKAGLQPQAKGPGPKTPAPAANVLGQGALDAPSRPLAEFEPPFAGFDAGSARMDAPPRPRPGNAHGFSFSRVGVLGMQRKCACGDSCDGCGKKRAPGIQTKLVVNEPGDAYEQEADRVADAMMGSFTHPPPPKPHAEGEPVQPAEGELTSGGERLAPGVAEFYETRFGRDFSAVRVHTGATAARYSDAVNAYAFTYGNHIWLGPGLPQQPSHILAHELAHVVQQTQPPPLTSAPERPGMSPSPQSLQRAYAPYWTPKNKKTDSHKLILPEIGKKNSIFTEAPVPNAYRKGSGEGGEIVEGRADLYRAEKGGSEAKTVGIWFAGDKSPKNLPAPSALKYGGKSFVRQHASQSAPQADEGNGSVIRARYAPDKIWLGELKPSHGTEEAHKGREQLDFYEKGYLAAQAGVNGMPADKRDAGWPDLKINPISVKIPEQFEFPSDSNQKSESLIIIDNYVRYVPLRPVLGKVHVAESPDKGILNYTWEPDSAVAVAARRLGDIRSSRIYVRNFGEVVNVDLVRPLRQSPIQGARKARPEPSPSLLKSAPRRIQAKGPHAPVVEAKDPFDEPAFKKWKEDHRRLSDIEKPKLEKTEEFKEAKIESLAVEDRKAAIKSGFKFPAITPEETEHVKTLGQIEFWTSAPSEVVGRLRYTFGGVFVKFHNAFLSIRERFRKILEGKKSPSSGGLTGTIIRIAFDILKVAGRILIERTANHLAASLKAGVELKLKELIPQDKVEDFQRKVDEIKELADQLENQARETVESLVKNTITPFEKYVGTIVSIAGTVSKLNNVISKVRWGARVIACLSPPGWGCLWILAESVIEKFASHLVDTCWFKKEVTPLVTDIDFVKKLPVTLAQTVINEFRPTLPVSLQGVLTDVKQGDVETNIPPHEVCDENDSYKSLSTEQSMLADVMKEVGEEKWNAWIRLTELYGVNKNRPLTVKDINKMRSELKKASLDQLKMAADMYPAISGDKEVAGLTEFLEQVKDVQEQMQGGGGEGEGGKGGYSVNPTDEPVKGEGKKSRHQWEVVRGVVRGLNHGDVIKIDTAAVIKGVVVTNRNIEVRVTRKLLLPNQSNPVKAVYELTVTKQHTHNFAKEHGPDFVKKIGFEWHRYHSGTVLHYTLQLKGEGARK